MSVWVLQRRNWQVMGTRASFAVSATPSEADTAATTCAEILAELESQFSSYLPESEVSRFAAGRLPGGPSDSLREVLAACSWLEQVSGGIFTMHPRGPDSELDVAGYVKGWAVDRAADALDAAGLGNWALTIGGDWRCRGGHPEGRPWRIAIVDPVRTTLPRAVVALSDGAVATSGRYERGDHVALPPGITRTAQPPASFTVTGPQLAFADAFATVGLLMGDSGLTWVAGFQGYAGALIRPDGSMEADTAMPLNTSSPWRNSPDLSPPRGGAS